MSTRINDTNKNKNRHKNRPRMRIYYHAAIVARPPRRPLCALCIIVIALSVAAFQIRSTLGFVVLPTSTVPTILLPTKIRARTRIRFLKYAGGNNNDNDVGNLNANGNVKGNVPDLGNTSMIQFDVNPTNGDIRFENNNTNIIIEKKKKKKKIKKKIKKQEGDNEYDSITVSSTAINMDILELSKRVKVADFLQQQQQEEPLILPIRKITRTAAVAASTFAAAAAVATADSSSKISKNKNKNQQIRKKQNNDNKIRSSISNSNKKKSSSSSLSSSSLKRRWRRLPPSQKFRLRLGLAAFVIASFWNIIVVRYGGGIINIVGIGITTTVSAPKYGVFKLLRKWVSSRGFQGLAAAGRTVAYFWAILVGYPRMLDKRSKSSRRKREDETIERWRTILRTSSEEIVRLRTELSLLEKEIRVFRREILAIRAARINNINSVNNNDNDNDINNDNKNNNNRSAFAERNEESKLIREVIVQEMYQLTRLRDDTRALLTASRKRWAEIYAKRPSFSNSTTTIQQQQNDPQQLEFELDAAATLGYVVGDNNNNNSNNSERLRNQNRDGDTSSSTNNNNNDILLSGF